MNGKSLKCNLCGSNNYNVFKKIGDYLLIRCKHCGLVCLNCDSVEEKMNKKYSLPYYAKTIFDREPKTEGELKRQINKNAERAKQIISEVGKQGKLLDIGCGPGFFIACMREYGWDVTGVDVSDWATDFARKKLGLNVFTGAVEKIKFNDNFNLVTMMHVLEHLPDPVVTLKRVYELISDEGWLFITGPNLASFDRIWHGRNWRWFTDRSHLYFFTPETYRRVLEKAGFLIQKISFQRWNPLSHLMEMQFSGRGRVDHQTEVIKMINAKNPYKNSFIFKIINKLVLNLSVAFRLRGRDLSILARKKI